MKKTNLYDKFIKILITISLIFLLLFWQIIPLVLLKTLNINKDTLNETIKVIITFISDILLLLIFILIYKKTITRDFKKYFNNELKSHLKESFSTWLIGFGIMIVSNILIALITNGKLAQNEETVRALIDSHPLYMLFQIMIYAPITEELIFRKSIKDICDNKIIYILTSGLIFGGLHIISSLQNPMGLLYLIPYSALGCVFAYLYQKTDNIFSTITAHSFHNTLAFLIYIRGIR